MSPASKIEHEEKLVHFSGESGLPGGDGFNNEVSSDTGIQCTYTLNPMQKSNETKCSNIFIYSGFIKYLYFDISTRFFSTLMNTRYCRKTINIFVVL